MEEHVLFPALLLAAPDDTALLQLVTEHGGERTLVDEIEEALMSRKGMAFFRGSRQLTSLLRNHCEKEESIVCKLAEQCLSNDQDDDIAIQFTTNRAQVENYGDFSRLEQKYAPKPPADSLRQDYGHTRTRGSASYR